MLVTGSRTWTRDTEITAVLDDLYAKHGEIILAAVVNSDPEVRGRLAVVFVPNYGVTLAQARDDVRAIAGRLGLSVAGALISPDALKALPPIAEEKTMLPITTPLGIGAPCSMPLI